MATHSLRLGAVILALCVVGIFNLLASNSGSRLQKSIREKEQTLSRLDEALTRESACWEMMKSAESLNNALLKNGLSMAYPRTDQVVRIRADGRPYPGQRSVARAASRNKSVSATAQYRRRR